MKKTLTLIGIFAMLIFTTNSLLAVKPVKNTPQNQSSSTELSEKETKKLEKFEKKLEKRMAKMEAKANKADVDFDDPVDKWMWFWIFGWGAGLLLSIIALATIGALVGVLALLFWTFGTVALIIWLVKKFS